MSGLQPGKRFTGPAGPVGLAALIAPFLLFAAGMNATILGSEALTTDPGEWVSIPSARGIVSPYERDGLTPVYERGAEWIVKEAGLHKGYCLVLDCGTGRLAFEIARRTEMRVIAVDEKASNVAAARRALDAAGLYGSRVTVREGSAKKLPFTDFFANLIVSDAALVSGRTPGNPDELYRVLRPCGGTLVVGRPDGAEGPSRSSLKGRLRKLLAPAAPGEGRLVEDKSLWAVIRRGPLPGAGDWTHTYADPGNSACSNDTRVQGPLELQWFGRPGPRRMIDRHHRNVPPLCREGRLFVPGDDVIFAVDAYNGTPLWEVQIPGLRRLGVFLDTSNLVVDDDFLYAAQGDICKRFRVATGEAAGSFSMPQPAEGERRHWSYLALAGNRLFGSGRLPGASYTKTSRAADVALWYDNMSIVTSRYLFALDKKTGRKAWTYRSGVILNTTIAIDKGRVHFIESQSPAALKNRLGRMPQRTFLEKDGNFLVALDAEKGTLIYRRKIDLSDCRLITYLNASDGMLLVSGCRYIDAKLWYFFYGLSAATGKKIWRQSHNSGYDPGGGHGEQNRHPTIVGGVAYAYPYAYRLKTGKKIKGYAFSRSGHGCGGVSASAHSLFWRGGNSAMFDLRPGGGISKINHVSRPGCWINIIPAGGLVLIPEASSGCTCAFPLQTSIAYRPKGE